MHSLILMYKLSFLDRVRYSLFWGVVACGVCMLLGIRADPYLFIIYEEIYTKVI
jgi:hypothetical protein